MIYAIGIDYPTAPCGGWVKFGYAQDPKSRLLDLQVGCPLRLRLWGTVDLPDEDEIIFHEAFREAKVRGEWFETVPSVCEAISIMESEDCSAKVEKILKCLNRNLVWQNVNDAQTFRDRISALARQEVFGFSL